jgi:hypothetical protein
VGIPRSSSTGERGRRSWRAMHARPGRAVRTANRLLGKADALVQRDVAMPASPSSITSGPTTTRSTNASEPHLYACR